MSAKRAKKSEKLPKYGTPNRKKMVSWVTTLESYKQSIEKGYPFFTKEELEKLGNRYKVEKLGNRYKGGLTWDDVEHELSAKGVFLKKVTFRKYIQDQNLSGAIDYRNTDKGRMAIFPADTISHINFIQYFYKVATGEIVDELLSLFRDTQISYLEAVESKLQGNDGDIVFAINTFLPYGACDAEKAIREGLARRPEDQQKALTMLDDIWQAYVSVVVEKIERLVAFLKDNQIFFAETLDEKSLAEPAAQTKTDPAPPKDS